MASKLMRYWLDADRVRYNMAELSSNGFAVTKVENHGLRFTIVDIWTVKFAGLNTCKWPNNNHRIGFDIILELSGPQLNLNN